MPKKDKSTFEIVLPSLSVFALLLLKDAKMDKPISEIVLPGLYFFVVLLLKHAKEGQTHI